MLNQRQDSADPAASWPLLDAEPDDGPLLLRAGAETRAFDGAATTLGVLTMSWLPIGILDLSVLGELRIPLDYFAALLIARSLEQPTARVSVIAVYYLITAINVLLRFNVSPSALSFYAQFVEYLPRPGVGVWLATLTSVLVIIVVPKHLPNIQFRQFALVTTALTAGLLGIRLAGGPVAGRRIPAPSYSIPHRVLEDLGQRTERTDSKITFDPSTLTANEDTQPEAFAWQSRTSLPQQLYVFVVESWADPYDGRMSLRSAADTLFGPRIVRVESGERSSQGGTLDGELRELCGIGTPLVRNPRVPRQCLPSRLRALGYETIAVHGYSQGFYLRRSIYPTMGFQYSKFEEQLRAKIRHCAGAFPGLCDDSLFSFADSAFASSKRFLYELTLQSHEPVPGHVKATAGDAHVETSVLIGHQFVRSSLGTIANSAAAECGALALFVGDHPPPSRALETESWRPVSFLYLRILASTKCASRRRRHQRAN